MHNENIPSHAELPSTRTLIRSTILAASAAGVILFTAILPAEYGIDPTGIGRALGLQRMGEIKISLAKEAAAEAAQAATLDRDDTQLAPSITSPTQPVSDVLKHEMKVALSPDEGTEIKVTMAKGQAVEYSWWTDGGPVSFDVHGDSKELEIDYHSYGKGSDQKSEGTIEAAFDGRHGWFWRNRTPETIVVTLQTTGGYTNIEHLK